MIMIMLHNNQLQSHCFRLSIHQRNSNTPSIPAPINCTLITRSKLRRSQSTDSNTHQKVSNSDGKGGTRSSNWLSNHFLGIKQKFKEIFKHKNSEAKRCEVTARKNSVHSRIKQRNLSVICQSGVSIDKKKLMENLSFRPFQNKKLINLKKGKLFRGTQRNNCNERLAKRIDCGQQFGGLVEQPLDIEVSEDEMGEDYLKSQYAAIQRRIQQEQTIRTEKRTIESLKFQKHRSEIKASHVPICLELDDPQSFKLAKRQSIRDFEQGSKKNIEKHSQLGMKRSSLSRRLQSKRQMMDVLKPHGSVGVILQI